MFASFYGSKSRFRSDFFSSSGIMLAPGALQNLVVTSGKPLASSKVCAQFGHMITATQAKKRKTSMFVPGSVTEAKMAKDIVEWNPSPGNEAIQAWQERVALIQSNPIVGVIAVFQHWNPDRRHYGDPVVRVLGIPALATVVGSIRTLGFPGLILSDIWDPELVEPTMAPVFQPVTECFLIMVALSGYSCTFKKARWPTYLMRPPPSCCLTDSTWPNW